MLIGVFAAGLVLTVMGTASAQSGQTTSLENLSLEELTPGLIVLLIISTAIFISSIVLWALYFAKTKVKGLLLEQASYNLPHWSIPQAFICVLLFLSAQVLGSLLTLFAFKIIQSNGGIAGLTETGRSIGGYEFKLDTYVLFVVEVLFCFFLILYVRAQRDGKQSLRVLGFRFEKTGRKLLKALVVFLMILPLVGIAGQISSYIIELLGQTPTPQVHGEVLKENMHTGYFYFFVFLIIIVAPIAEEMIFRGFFYAGLRKKLGMKWAMVTTAGVFAIIHWNALAFLPIFILTLGLCYVYERTQSLVAPMFLHFLFNSLNVLVIVLGVQ